MKTKHYILTLLVLYGSSNLFAQIATNIDGLRYRLFNTSDPYAWVLKRSDQPLAQTYQHQDVVIPETVTYNEITYRVVCIKDSAFLSCNKLVSVTIPETVTEIKRYAFKGSGNLTKVIFQSDNQDLILGNHVFEGCTVLTQINLPNGTQNIPQSAFEECNRISTITIPNSVTIIDKRAFYGCGFLSNISIGNSVREIGDRAFYDCCVNPTEIIIPNSVRSIGEEAFALCTGLRSITLGTNVSSIGKRAIPVTSYNTSNGIRVYSYAKTPPTIIEELYNLSYAPVQNYALHVPYGYLDDYMAVTLWRRAFPTSRRFEDLAQTTITVGNSGYATFCSPKAMDFSDITGIKAYIASRFNPSTGKLVLTRVTEVPAGEGLYIKGTPGEYVIPETTTSMFYSNLLKGVTATINISPTDGDKTNFILANGIHGIAFYTLSGEENLRTSKAYLQIPTDQVPEVKALKIIFEDEDDDPTGIAITSAISQEEETIYNLAGQRVSKAQKGINIINGKKVVIK